MDPAGVDGADGVDGALMERVAARVAEARDRIARAGGDPGPDQDRGRDERLRV